MRPTSGPVAAAEPLPTSRAFAVTDGVVAVGAVAAIVGLALPWSRTTDTNLGLAISAAPRPAIVTADNGFGSVGSWVLAALLAATVALVIGRSVIAVTRTATMPRTIWPLALSLTVGAAILLAIVAHDSLTQSAFYDSEYRGQGLTTTTEPGWIVSAAGVVLALAGSAVDALLDRLGRQERVR